MSVQQSVFKNVRTVGSVLDPVRVIVLHSGKESSVKHVRMMWHETSCLSTIKNGSAVHSAYKSYTVVVF